MRTWELNCFAVCGAEFFVLAARAVGDDVVAGFGIGADLEPVVAEMAFHAEAQDGGGKVFADSLFFGIVAHA